MTLAIITGLIIVGIALISIRVGYVVWRTGKSQKSRGRAPRPVSTLIVLGSGGHTAEMLNLLSVLQKERFNPRFYIAAATDNMSLQKARLLETSLANETGDKEPETSQFIQIYRSREVGQSYVTSVWTTLVAMAHALWLMFRIRPKVLTFLSFCHFSNYAVFLVVFLSVALDILFITILCQHFGTPRFSATVLGLAFPFA